jgi:hypothetical protein
MEMDHDKLQELLAEIGAARTAHTDAESKIFASYVVGDPFSAVTPVVEQLIAADTELAKLLRELLGSHHS